MNLAQKRFLRRCRRHLPKWLRKKVKALPVEIVFRAYPGHGPDCVYHHGERRIYIPKSYYRDWHRLSPWVRRFNKATVVHEFGHAWDFNVLSRSERDHLLLEFTGFPANHHYDFFDTKVPAHVTATERLATWCFGDWSENGCETYAEGFVVAFTDLPARKTFNDSQLQAVRSSVERSEA